VDERLSSLNSESNWQPDTARAFARFRRRDHDLRIRRAGWVGATAATMAAGILLLIVSGPRACANPVECANEMAQASAQNYKESGSQGAPVTFEIYSDYQCQACAQAFANLIPELTATYVKTGKAKLVHRDYPLPQHQYAKLAARYANAAGRLGHYDAAVAQIFKTQSVWEKDGAIDRALAPALPADVMQKARQMARNDASLDDTVTADMAMAAKDGINQTPSLVVAAKGKRRVIPGAPSVALLKGYVDEILK
jgi:protein-disulfide isomerase